MQTVTYGMQVGNCLSGRCPSPRPAGAAVGTCIDSMLTSVEELRVGFQEEPDSMF